MKLFQLATLFFISTSAFAAEPVEIKMKSISYDPKQTEISQGESVIWKNVSYTDHSATSEEEKPAFDTGMILPGKQSKPIKFDKPGEYPFHCHMHGKTMSGRLTVKAAKK